MCLKKTMTMINLSIEAPSCYQNFTYGILLKRNTWSGNVEPGKISPPIVIPTWIWNGISMHDISENFHKDFFKKLTP